MLISLIILATFALSAAANWLADGAAPPGSGTPTVAPRDPSTLALALIAIGTLTIYWMVTRRTRRTTSPLRTGRFSDHSAAESAGDPESHPSRDAA